MLFQIAKKGSMEKGFKITRSPRNLATAFKCDACVAFASLMQATGSRRKFAS